MRSKAENEIYLLEIVALSVDDIIWVEIWPRHDVQRGWGGLVKIGFGGRIGNGEQTTFTEPEFHFDENIFNYNQNSSKNILIIANFAGY